MDKIARLTQTITANGVTVIDKRFVLGKCKSFRITNLTKQARDQGFSLSTGKAGNDAGSVEDSVSFDN